MERGTLLLLIVRMSQVSSYITPPFQDRRSRSALNRARRALNNYWLVPIVVLYLQLLTSLITMPGTDSTGLVERNRTFFSGIPLLAELVTTDFPYAAIGHGKEVAHALGRGSASMRPIDLTYRIREEKRGIYLALLNSRNERTTEIGGVVTTTPDGHIALYAIPSTNGTFIRELKRLPPGQFLSRLAEPEGRELVTMLTGNANTVDRLIRIAANPKVTDADKERALGSLLFSLEVASEARYLLRPMDFKGLLGRMPGWHYAGVYHFHNELGSPPSDADIKASYHSRQLVFCLTEDGFDLYDIKDGVASISRFGVKSGTDLPEIEGLRHI